MNNRKRGFIVTRIERFSLMKEGVCVPSFRSAVRLYKKYCHLYPNSLICIQEIFVMPPDCPAV